MPPEKIIIFRIGTLGDTLVSVPAMWAVRHHFHDARVTLLCDHHPKQKYVLGADLLSGSGIVDDFLLYPVDNSRWGKALRPFRMIRTLRQLRARKFDTLVYLPPSTRTREQIERDRKFFKLAGIRRFIGMNSFHAFPVKQPGKPLPLVPREADLLLARIAADGVPTPPAGTNLTTLSLNPQDDAEVTRWHNAQSKTHGEDGGRRWIAIGPGSKMPAKLWPAVGAPITVHEDDDHVRHWNA